MLSKSISALYVYPIKSCAGIEVPYAKVTSSGFANDRCYLLIDDKGRFMTQRKYPKMALLRPYFKEKIEQKDLWLNIPDIADLPLMSDSEGTQQETKIWSDTVNVISGYLKVSAAISQFLGVNCQLVSPANDYSRNNRSGQTALSFADAHPYLVISEATVSDLNQRLSQSVGLLRFRPNIVIQGCMPYAEDQYIEMRINTVVFSAEGRCSRCLLPEVNPATGIRDHAEMTMVLQQYRSDEKGLWYLGQHFSVRTLESHAVLQVGDSIILGA